VQQILALLLVFHQTHNLARNKFARPVANQPIRALHFFDLQQMFLLRIKSIMQGEKRETFIDENLQRDNVGRQVEGFCISYFAAFSVHANSRHVIHERALSNQMTDDRADSRFYNFACD